MVEERDVVLTYEDYARAGVAEYWIVNLLDRRVEVCRDPTPPCQSRTSSPDTGRVRGRTRTLAPGSEAGTRSGSSTPATACRSTGWWTRRRAVEGLVLWYGLPIRSALGGVLQ